MLVKAILAITDQGLISGSNFLMGVLLARWLLPDEYGAYAIAFAIFILVSQFYQALILEPMSVFGGGRYRDRIREYMRALLWVHAGTAVVVVGFLGLATAIAHLLMPKHGLGSALAAVTVAAPFVLLLWLARRGYYLQLSPATATAGAFGYSVLVVIGVFVLHRVNRLSVFSAFLVMAIAAGVTSIFLLLKLGAARGTRMRRLPLTEAWSHHWTYGRWALASSLVVWMPFNAYYTFIGSFGGIAQAGELRALLNLALPVGQISTALALLLQTYTARVQNQHGARAMKAITSRITQGYAAYAVSYWVLICIFRQPIVHYLYAGKYDAIIGLIPLLAVASIVQVCAHGMVIGLRALEKPSSVFAAYSVAGLITVGIGVPATWAFGLPGVVGSMLLSYAAAWVTGQKLLHKRVRQHTAAA